jgi:hypothetical protein
MCNECRLIPTYNEQTYKRIDKGGTLSGDFKIIFNTWQEWGKKKNLLILKSLGEFISEFISSTWLQR